MIKSTFIAVAILLVLFVSISEEAIAKSPHCDPALAYCMDECGKFTSRLFRSGCEVGCAIGYLRC